MATLAVFDLDGTLILNPSAERRFIRFLIRRRRLGITALLRSVLFAVRWAPRFGRHVLKKNKAYLTQIPVTEAERLGRIFVSEILLPLLQPGVLERLREHQRLGHEVALLTGAPGFIAQPLCEALEIPLVIATECATAGGRFLPAPPGRHPFGRDKLTLTEQLCRQRAYSLRQVAAYADSIHDQTLLAAAGTAFAVSPDPPLRRLAQTRGWPVVEVSVRARVAAVPAPAQAGTAPGRVGPRS